MLCSILSILFFNAYPQDTTCTYFKHKRVIEFDYQTSEIIYEVEQEERFYEIEITYGNVFATCGIWRRQKYPFQVCQDRFKRVGRVCVVCLGEIFFKVVCVRCGTV